MSKRTLGLLLGPLLAVVALVPAAGSTGTAAQRMRAMRTAAVEETTTTTTTAPVEPTPVPTTPTTQIAEPAVVVAPVPPVPAPVAPKLVVTPGHYSCPGDQDHQYDTPCALDTADDPGPNAGSDDPAKTAAGADAGYAGRMIDGFCEAKPILCDDPDHPIL